MLNSPTTEQGIPDGAQAKEEPFLEVRDLQKRFGGVHALKGVSFTIERGQTYHLLGENGCGKSTLIKIVSGAQRQDTGSVHINGKLQTALDPISALAAGIETVYQDLSLLPNLTVEENIGLSQQLVASGGKLFRLLNRGRVTRDAIAALEVVKLPTDRAFLKTPIQDLPIATRQLVAIARAVASDAGLVIMDEPTTSLTRREVDNLVAVIRDLHRKGVSVIFVTHKLDEAKAIGGRAIVMRDGLVVKECGIAEQSKSELAFWMTGKQLDDARYRSGSHEGANLLTVTGAGRRGSFSDVNLTLARGEILGITGLLDSGRNALALALAGIAPVDTGTMLIEGRPILLRSPGDAITAGIGYVPEDRLSEGLFLEKSIRDNVVAVVLDRLRSALGLVDGKRSRALANETIADLEVVAPNIDSPVQSLSGGNQQRVLIGRWLTINPRLLILHGPTVGVDVGSKDTIFRIIQRLAGQGMSVLIISDDLPELLQNCDRVLVMNKGRITDEFAAEGLTEATLYSAMGAEIVQGNPR